MVGIAFREDNQALCQDSDTEVAGWDRCIRCDQDMTQLEQGL